MGLARGIPSTGLDLVARILSNTCYWRGRQGSPTRDPSPALALDGVRAPPHSPSSAEWLARPHHGDCSRGTISAGSRRPGRRERARSPSCTFARGTPRGGCCVLHRSGAIGRLIAPLRSHWRRGRDLVMTRRRPFDQPSTTFSWRRFLGPMRALDRSIGAWMQRARTSVSRVCAPQRRSRSSRLSAVRDRMLDAKETLARFRRVALFCVNLVSWLGPLYLADPSRARVGRSSS